MRIYCWTTTFWNDEAMAKAKADGPLGLKAWYDRVTLLFSPVDYLLACGSESNSAFNPLWPEVAKVVNSGVPFTKPYDPFYWSYAGCAMTAGIAYALWEAERWDLLVSVDAAELIGAVDLQLLLTEFLSRPELLLSENWFGRPGSVFALKPEGAARWLHQRRRANLIEDGPKPMLLEDELGEIFSGKWWNPWPDIESCRYPNSGKSDEEVMKWPFIESPPEHLIERYLAEQTSQARPIA